MDCGSGGDSADGADGRGDDDVLVNLLAGTAGGFIQRDDLARGSAIAAQAAGLDAVEGVFIKAGDMRHTGFRKANGRKSSAMPKGLTSGKRYSFRVTAEGASRPRPRQRSRYEGRPVRRDEGLPDGWLHVTRLRAS